MIYIIFFIIGILQDFCAANWVVSMKKKSYAAGFWAFWWSFANSVFVLTIARSLEWTIVPVYAAGIAVGTTIVLHISRTKGEK